MRKRVMEKERERELKSVEQVCVIKQAEALPIGDSVLPTKTLFIRVEISLAAWIFFPHPSPCHAGSTIVAMSYA
jgi:hypothetical protein